MHLDRVALDLLAPAVQLLLELLARQHAAGVEHQRVQQVELARRQRHRLARLLHRARRRVEHDVLRRQPLLRLAVRAAHQRAQPRGELVAGRPA